MTAMHKFVEIIRKVTKCSYLADGNGVIRLFDNGMQASINGLHSDSVAVKVDYRAKSHPGLMSHGGKISRVCDYILICQWKGKIKFVFVELKESAGDIERGLSQLAFSSPLGAYIRDLIRRCNSGAEFHPKPSYLLITRNYAGGQNIKARLKDPSRWIIEKKPHLATYSKGGVKIEFAVDAVVAYSDQLPIDKILL